MGDKYCKRGRHGMAHQFKENLIIPSPIGFVSFADCKSIVPPNFSSPRCLESNLVYWYILLAILL